MKARKQNISFSKSGSGSVNSRIMLPITWVRDLGLSQEEREVYIYQIGDEIVIRKTPMIFDKKEAAKIAFEEIDKIVSNTEYIEFGGIVETAKNITKSYFLEERETKLKIQELISVLQDSFLYKNYEFVIDDKKQYFFDKKKYSFKTVEEFEKYFELEKN